MCVCVERGGGGGGGGERCREHTKGWQRKGKVKGEMIKERVVENLYSPTLSD